MALKTVVSPEKRLNFQVAYLDEEMIQNVKKSIAKVLGSSKINYDGVRFEQYYLKIILAFLNCVLSIIITNLLENHSSLDPLKYGYTQ